MSAALPDWCELVQGDGPVLLVAPHGGRRPPVDPNAPPANLKVNDVHTAELTRELAARLGASAVINHGCDRNVLDLNRTSQVRRQAPWFLELLHERIAAILARFASAEVLFIHGWNVGQAKCDLGIGARETDDGTVTPGGAALTVTRPYFEGRIRQLRCALESQQIATFVGVRYPASHPNNLLQVFTARGEDGAHTQAERQFAAWASQARLEAVQLELGVPLRWPGIWRDRLLEALVGQFAGRTVEANASSESRAASSPMTDSSLPHAQPGENAAGGRRAISLQFYDPAADIGLLAGVGPIGKETSAARLLLFLGGQRVALFTGEQTPPRCLRVEPLRFQSHDAGTTLLFDGPILHLDDGTTYLDLEAAFAASTLDDIQVELRFDRVAADAAGVEFGRVEGWISVAGLQRRVSAGAYANATAGRGRQGLGYASLAATFTDGDGLVVNIGSGSKVVEFRDRDAIVRDCGAELSPPQPGSPLELQLADNGVVRATPISRMEILRSLPGGGHARVTFGTARFEWQGKDGHGVYEYADLPGRNLS